MSPESAPVSNPYRKILSRAGCGRTGAPYPVSNPYRKILSIAEKYTVKGIENVSNPYRKILSVGVWACVAVIVGFQSLQEDSKPDGLPIYREDGKSFQSLQEDSKRKTG